MFCMKKGGQKAKQVAQKEMQKAREKTTEERGPPTPFSSELCDCGQQGCCDNINMNTLFCPFVQIAYNHAVLEGNIKEMPKGCLCCSGLPPGMTCPELVFATPDVEYHNRRRLRTVGNVVEEDPCNDCFLTLFCFPLVVCQNAREIEARKKMIFRDANKQKAKVGERKRHTNLFDCCDGPASTNMRTLFCPCLQIALNHAVLEGHIDRMPDGCLEMPHGVTCCDLLFASPALEYHNRRRIETVGGIHPADSLATCLSIYFCGLFATCQDAREIINMQEEVVPVIQMAYRPPKPGKGGSKGGKSSKKKRVVESSDEEESS